MLLVKNKKALRNYEVIDKFLGGIVLKGYEVKAVREKNVSFEGSYVKLNDDELYLIGMHIGKYSKQSQDIEKVNPERQRKILVNKNEILKISKELQQKGKSAVPLALLLKNNLIKIEFAIVKGRKKYEKKHLEKERQIQKDLEKFNSSIRRSI